MHENAPSSNASQRLETRSDLSDVVCDNKNTVSDIPSRPLILHQSTSLQVEDVSFASSSDFSYSIKNFDMQNITTKRRNHHVSFQGQKLRAPREDDLQVDDVSMRSSLDLSGKADSVNKEKEIDLPSDGASTFRDFVPREVANLERKIKTRD